jgi:hypothetical protein
MRPLRPELDGRPSFSWSNLWKHHQNQHNCRPLGRFVIIGGSRFSLFEDLVVLLTSKKSLRPLQSPFMIKFVSLWGGPKCLGGRGRSRFWVPPYAHMYMTRAYCTAAGKVVNHDFTGYIGNKSLGTKGCSLLLFMSRQCLLGSSLLTTQNVDFFPYCVYDACIHVMKG